MFIRTGLPIELVPRITLPPSADSGDARFNFLTPIIWVFGVDAAASPITDDFSTERLEGYNGE